MNTSVHQHRSEKAVDLFKRTSRDFPFTCLQCQVSSASSVPIRHIKRRIGLPLKHSSGASDSFSVVLRFPDVDIEPRDRHVLSAAVREYVVFDIAGNPLPRKRRYSPKLACSKAVPGNHETLYHYGRKTAADLM